MSAVAACHARGILYKSHVGERLGSVAIFLPGVLLLQMMSSVP